MSIIRNQRVRIGLLGLASGGVALQASCTAAEIQALAVGLQAVAGTLAQDQQEDDISFGDWLANEFND